MCVGSKRWAKLLFILLFIFVLGFRNGVCRLQTNFTVDDSVNYKISAYDSLYQAVYSGNAQKIWPYTKNNLPAIRKQAWSALARTPVSDSYDLEERVEAAGLPQAWFALSMHNLKTDQLRILENRWIHNPDQRAGISRVMGKQGDRRTLQFLLDHLGELQGKDPEFETALAISRLMMHHEPSLSNQLKIIRAAFQTVNPDITRAYLYGAYRKNENIFTSDVKADLFRLWQFYGIGRAPEIDQYLIKILGKEVPDVIFRLYSNLSLDSLNVQEGIELAHLLPKKEIDSSAVKVSKALLLHKNPHVVMQTLQNIRKASGKRDSLYAFITDSLLNNNSPDPVWLESLLTINGNQNLPDSTQIQRMDSMARENPYELPRVLDIYRKSLDADVYLDTLRSVIRKDSLLKAEFAVNALRDYWESLESSKKTQAKIRKVRSMAISALMKKDRGVAVAVKPLLEDPTLFHADDYSLIEHSLDNFKLPWDIEVYQNYGHLFKNRFSRPSQSFIDSLAGQDYAPLNKSLSEMGWKVEVPESSTHDFRKPDWNRLNTLGAHPTWVLEMKSDTIKIKLNTFQAPATVSAIDSLTGAGAYDGVPFHRIVPNFVIQGGDIERGDGYGGPHFIIPTEATELPFKRGAVGIASAGKDTEGSQFFIMNQWKPHLNGHYTLFGHVTDGMEAVDRIVVGEKVLHAYIKRTPASTD